MLTKNYEKIFPSVRLTSEFLNDRVEAVVTCLRESKTPLTMKQILEETGLRSAQGIVDTLVGYGFIDKEVREEGVRTETKIVRVYRGNDGEEMPSTVEINGYTYTLDVAHRKFEWREKEITFPVRRAYYTWVG